MVGKTHLYSGLCAGAGYALWAGLPLVPAALAVSAGMIGGVLPDLDHRKSKVTQKTGILGFCSSHLFKHRGVLHTPIVYFALWGVLTMFVDSDPLTHAVICGLLVGELSHLFLDMLNPSGIPLLWPLTRKRISLLPIPTGGKLDAMLGMAALAGTVVLLLLILFR